MKTLDTIVNELETTIGAETGRDPFWGQAEIKLLRALVSYVKEARPAEKQNPDEVLKILLVNKANICSLLKSKVHEKQVFGNRNQGRSAQKPGQETAHGQKHSKIKDFG